MTLEDHSSFCPREFFNLQPRGHNLRKTTTSRLNLTTPPNMNFGVREVALHTAPQGPGWAYVPDTGINASVSALQPTARKRQRTELTSNHETSAKQDAKILRDILALERENHRDVLIPIPPRPKDNLGRSKAPSLSLHLFTLPSTFMLLTSRNWRKRIDHSEEQSS